MIEIFLPYQLNIAAEAASRTFEAVYKKQYGMLRTEWRVLFHLGRFGEMTAKEICDRGNLHKTKVSRSVAALELKRYVVRERSQYDRRHERLSLTALGKKVFAQLSLEAEVCQAQLTKSLSQTELEVLSSCLKKLAKNS